MKTMLLAALICSFMLFGAVNALISLQECQKQINLTAIDLNTDGTERTVERCLYYALSSEADKKAHRKDALRLEAPLKDLDHMVQVKVVRQDITRVVDNSGNLKDMSVGGMIWVQWHDDRMTWNAKEWKQQQTLKLANVDDVWHPRFMLTTWFNGHPGDLSIPGSLFPRVVWVDSIGTVTMMAEYVVEPACQIDFSDYPKDSHQCCFETELVSGQLMEVKLSVDKNVDINHDRGEVFVADEWRLADFSVGALPSHSMLNDRIQTCFVVARRSGTLKIELALPVVVSIGLVVSSPLFGDLRTQTFVKMFAILVQLISLQGAGQRVPDHAFMGATPSIYRFYEFSIMLTLMSFLMTLVFMALGRQQRKWPPPHNLVKNARSFNRNVCCHIIPNNTVARAMRYSRQFNASQNQPVGQSDEPASVDVTNVSTVTEMEPAAMESLDFSNDWLEIYVGANNFASLCTVSVYLLVSLIILS